MDVQRSSTLRVQCLSRSNNTVKWPVQYLNPNFPKDVAGVNNEDYVSILYKYIFIRSIDTFDNSITMIDPLNSKISKFWKPEKICSVAPALVLV